jgi:hypothetical protein
VMSKFIVQKRNLLTSAEMDRAMAGFALICAILKIII